jgi:REP element-mobilizing transposase RayT
MPRKSRIDAPGTLHHVIVRGIEGRKIFEDDKDQYDFIKRLGLILTETQTECYAWALIPNHFHLLIRTGEISLSTVMRRLLTGHAINYNRRHQRHGHLFQNRYKSIICQEDTYLLELVRYIHLNPLRANLVDNLNQLDKYPFSGHGVIMGKHKQSWQNRKLVLLYFNEKIVPAKKAYKAFIKQGVDQGPREDLIGGGLIRSVGGWTAVSEMRKANIHEKSDERILGDGQFVAQVLSKSQESLERRSMLKSKKVDVDYIVERVAKLLNLTVDEIHQPGKYKHLVMARSIICYWAVRELGENMSVMAKRFGLSIVAVSKSVKRGAEIVKSKGYQIY